MFCAFSPGEARYLCQPFTRQLAIAITGPLVTLQSKSSETEPALWRGLLKARPSFFRNVIGTVVCFTCATYTKINGLLLGVWHICLIGKALLYHLVITYLFYIFWSYCSSDDIVVLYCSYYKLLFRSSFEFLIQWFSLWKTELAPSTFLFPVEKGTGCLNYNMEHDMWVNVGL